MSPKDCVSYDPENLSLAESGVEWILESGAKKLISFDSEAKANKAAQVAHKYSSLCFIGRNNDRDERYLYITTYWENPSGLPIGPIRLNDCDPYDPTSVELENMGASGWRLQTSGTPLSPYFDSVGDALRGREVAMQHTSLCMLDRDNEPGEYKNTHEYWQG
ncbi:MAG: hypothetical protein L0Y54_04400 [Sporichthyaceae bacterium]|nr:hypothetical protein [Sporichthyaceae bacterium]